MSFLTVSAIVPPATVLPYAAASAPDGWLLCDGSAVSRTTYAALFAAIGTTYGVGDGSTTFNLPNTQGVFLRGAGSQTISAISYSGTRGTTEADQMQGHLHNMNINVAAEQDGGGAITSGGVGVAAQNFRPFFSASSDSIAALGANGTPRTGTQTHPANISVNYIIKI